MTTRAQFLTRNTLLPLANGAPATVRVAKYSRHVLGGPAAAELVVNGSEPALLAMMRWLRYGVQIDAAGGPSGRPVWWGFVHEAKLQIGALSIGMSLDAMANRVAVAYTVQVPGTTGQQRQTTTFVQDADSVGEYGTKELLLSMTNTTPAAAAAARARALAARSTPRPQLDKWGNDAGALQLVLSCRGWFDAFDWRYAALASQQLVVSYEAEPEDTTIEVGSASTNTQYTQAFTMPAGTYGKYELLRGMAKIVRLGAPADNLLIELCADAGAGVPGTVLATMTFAGSTAPTSHTKVEVQADSTGQTVPGGAYVLRVRRSGGVDAANFYRVAANTAAGFAGQLRRFDGASWVNISADMIFSATFGSVRETTDQIQTVYASYQQFCTGIEVETASGVYTATGRAGDTTARAVIEDCLASQTAGGDRLTAEITIDRRLRVFAEPVAGANDYYIDRRGNIATRMAAPVAKVDCMAGVWVRVRDTQLAGDFVQFIEEAEYTPDGDKYAPRARDQRDAFDVSAREG